MNAQEKVVYTACQGWGCHEICVLKTFVKNDKIERTERAILKGSQPDRLGICQRGIMSGKFPYIPEKMLYPLKRVGKRGEGKFERISWEQAFDEIGAKLNEIRDKYGSRAVLVNTFFCGIPNNSSGSTSIALAQRFIHTFDATVPKAEAIDMAINQSATFDFGSLMVSFMQDPSYWSQHHPKYMIIWGGNPIGGTRASHTSRMFMDIQESGTKIVNVGIMYDSTAAKADQFVPINPGTDAALALSMANVLIQENLYDEVFLTEHTVAPFLVREDNGLYLRESDVIPGSDSKKYVAWDKASGKPLFVAPHATFSEGHPDLLASVVVNEIPCKTAFLKLKEHVTEWTPESQEKITGVPASVARQIIHEYVENKPAALFLNYGMRYKNAGQSGRAVDLLPILSGNLGLPGGRMMMGGLSPGHPVSLDSEIIMPDGIENLKGTVVSVIDLIDSFDKPEEQQYKAYFVPFSNPVQNWPNRNLWEEKIFPNMDLIVVNEIRETDTTAFADYVLPEASMFEREEILAPVGNCIVLAEPAIQPLGETKLAADIWRGIAERVGIGEYFNKTNEEWLKVKLQTDNPAIEGITLERLRQEKIIRLNVPDVVPDTWENMDFSTPSGRIELYREEAADIDLPMATFTEPQIHGLKRSEYPLQFYPGRSRFFMQGQFTEIPELRALAGKESTIRLNPKTAKERKICDGDLVEVFNDRGSVRAKAHLTEMLPPGLAHVLYAYPAKDYMTEPPTVLSSALNTREVQDEWSEKFGMLISKAIEVEGTPPTVAINLEGTNETLWDDLCEVRKVEEVTK